ncbi:hypothetical protein [Klebsiella pneumoniae]|uniref:hypothetical protein n=1 Tax=Klebsiella pneumoniae TaxID=573 RepID=UPI00117B2AAD|nr:hypothetical protein [Klebsiella pneumoniae]
MVLKINNSLFTKFDSMAVGKFNFYWGKRGMVLKGKGILGSGLHPYAYAPNKFVMAYVKTEPNGILSFWVCNPLQEAEE